MKALLLAFIVSSLTVSGAFASESEAARVICSGHGASFYATLINSKSGSSDYFSIKDAFILGGFLRGNLNCSSNQELTGVHCVGYLNERVFVKTSFEQTGSELNLIVGAQAPWSCSIEK